MRNPSGRRSGDRKAIVALRAPANCEAPFKPSLLETASGGYFNQRRIIGVRLLLSPGLPGRGFSFGDYRQAANPTELRAACV